MPTLCPIRRHTRRPAWNADPAPPGSPSARSTQLRGRRDRNLWRSVTQFSGADLDALIRGLASGEAPLASLALERGHHVDGYRTTQGGAYDWHVR
jgi:hypothetical protein